MFIDDDRTMLTPRSVAGEFEITRENARLYLNDMVSNGGLNHDAHDEAYTICAEPDSIAYLMELRIERYRDKPHPREDRTVPPIENE